jgi:ABC-2 type transport system ATP-binding protein
MGVVERVCDRVVVVSGGRVVADDAVETLLRTDDRHTLRLESPDFDGEVLSALRERSEVTAVEPLGRGASLRVTADSQGLYDVMATLDDHGVALERVETVEPDLEEVFVDLTAGRDR